MAAKGRRQTQEAVQAERLQEEAEIPQFHQLRCGTRPVRRDYLTVGGLARFALASISVAGSVQKIIIKIPGVKKAIRKVQAQGLF